MTTTFPGSNVVAPTIDIALTLEQIEALTKTGGIAIANLGSKAQKMGPSSNIGRDAVREQMVLIGIQQILFAALQDANAEAA